VSTCARSPWPPSCLLPLLPGLLATPRRRPDHLDLSPSQRALSSPLALSHAHARASLPLAVTVATVIASPLRRLQSLRRHLHPLHADERKLRSTTSSSSSLSPLHLLAELRLSIHRLLDFPEPADHPYDPAMSSRPFSLSPCAQSLPLASLATKAESSMPPAMTPPWLPLAQLVPEHLNALLELPGSQRTHRHVLQCTAMPNPSLTELWQPP
jgi:hypothetical protein